MERIGYFQEGGKKYTLWGYLTFYCGEGVTPIAAKYDRIAPRDEDGELLTSGIKPGEIVVMPGFVYKIIPMSGMIMSEHLKKIQRGWKPKAQLVYEKSDAPAVDLGVIKPAGNA